MSKVRAIVFHEHGAPAEVARVGEVEIAAAAARARRACVSLASPINPADLNVIEGKYPMRPVAAGVPGVEGVGRGRGNRREVSSG